MLISLVVQVCHSGETLDDSEIQWMILHAGLRMCVAGSRARQFQIDE